MPFTDGTLVYTIYDDPARYGTVVGYDPDEATLVGVKWASGEGVAFISESLLAEATGTVLIRYWQYGVEISKQAVDETELAALDAVCDADPTLLEEPLGQDPEVRAQLRLYRGLFGINS